MAQFLQILIHSAVLGDDTETACIPSTEPLSCYIQPVPLDPAPRPSKFYLVSHVHVCIQCGAFESRKASPISLSVKAPMYDNTVGISRLFSPPLHCTSRFESQVRWFNHSNQAYSHILFNRLQSRGKASASA